MIHFKHAVDYYKFLVENFYNEAPYFKDYENEGKLDVDYNTGNDIEEYINYDSDCFEIDDDGSSYYIYEFFPPINHVVENIELLKYLVDDLINKTLNIELIKVKQLIQEAFIQYKPRKIKHQLRLIEEKMKDSIFVIDDMINIGEYEKNEFEHEHYNLVVENFIVTAETIKNTYLNKVEEFTESVNKNYLQSVSIL